MTTLISREIRFASRPRDLPTPENFELCQVTIPPLEEGQVLVKNFFMSVDPYMRGRMNDVKSYAPPFQLGQPLEGAAVGEIIESRAGNLHRGDIVTSNRGWREYFVAPASEVREVDGNLKPLSAYLGILGMNGLTAWVGLNLVDVKAGDCVFISSAAGATGSVAGQLAKLRGCRVIGSAGSSQKVKMLTEELGFDAAFNYKEGELALHLAAVAPDGIDVYFDSVGGEHLEAAISAMRPHGRIIACGAISKYNDETARPGPRNLPMIISKRLTIKGFIVLDSVDRMPEFGKEVGGYLADGKLRIKETVVVGIESAAQAFINLFHGANTGKMVVSLLENSSQEPGK